MFPQQALGEYNNFSPVFLDNCRDYNDLVGSNANCLGSANNSFDPFLQPRGAWALDGVIATPAGGATPIAQNATEAYISNTV